VEVDVRVVYGETLNEKKLKEVLEGNVSGCVDGWEAAVREVKAMLLSKSAKVVQRLSPWGTLHDGVLGG
jgi:hypothetical protein